MPDPARKVPTFPPNLARGSWEDLARAYGNMAAMQESRAIRVDDELAETKAAALIASSVAARTEQAVARLEKIVATLEHRIAPGGEVEQRAGQRAQLASSHTLEATAETVAARIVEAVKGPRDGPNNITPETVVEIVKKTRIAEKAASFDEGVRRAHDRREKILVGVAIALITAAISGSVGYAMRAMQSINTVTQQHP